MKQKQQKTEFVVCVRNEGYGASLEPRKIYRVLPDDAAVTHGLIRVLDESGEDYLYPAEYFAPITLPEDLVEALSLAV
jgi:hypothetical protein